MCKYCSQDTRYLAAKEDRLFAEKLRHLAALHDDLAVGRIKPHTPNMDKITTLSATVIRKLVCDYL